MTTRVICLAQPVLLSEIVRAIMYLSIINNSKIRERELLQCYYLRDLKTNHLHASM